MSIELTIGSDPALTIDSLQDLASTTGISSLLKLGNELSADLETPVGKITGNPSTRITYTSGTGTWTPGPIVFTLSGGVTGAIALARAADLPSYVDTLPDLAFTGSAPTTAATPLKISGDPIYLAIELDFNITGSLSGSYTSGLFGLTASASGTTTLSVTCYHLCPPEQTLRQAVAAAFAAFTLPLHDNTLENLRVGNILHYNFNANLQMGLGGSVGIDKVFYAGQYVADVAHAQVLTVTAGIAPEIQAGAELAFNYSYAGTFEAVLQRTSQQQATFHLFRSKNQTVGGSLHLGATFTAGATLTPDVSTSQLTRALVQALPDELQAPFTSDVLTPAFHEVTTWVGEIQSRIEKLLSPINNQGCAFDAAVSSTANTLLLSDYTIDLTRPYKQAWQAMLAGRFVDALAIAGSGLTLSAGSGTESFYSKTASIHLNLFGKLDAAWSSATIRQSQLVYAGNGVFHLVVQQGRQQLSTINGSSREIDVYFAAEANQTGGQIDVGAIDLHFVLKATDKAKFGVAIAQVVSQLTSGPRSVALVESIRALAVKAGTTQTLDLVFKPSAYGRLASSTIVKGQPVNEALDQPNYAAFAKACMAVVGPGNPIGNLTFRGAPLTYDIWAKVMLYSNDSQPYEGERPNRTANAGYNGTAASALASYFDNPGSQGNLVFYALLAAGDFMNLCADLRALADRTLPAPALLSAQEWADLAKRLASIVKNDLNSNFIVPAGLALSTACGTTPATVSAPDPSLPPGTSLGVTATFA